MGRIENALRRAKGEPPVDSAPTDTAFVAPWRFAEVDVEPQPGPADEPAPGAARFIDEVVTIAAPAFSTAWTRRLINSGDANPQLVEQFRSLGAALHRLQGSAGVKVLMITSAEPGEGKTLTAVNLALCLSESYQRRVLLVDADLRRPSIRELSPISSRPGLSEALKATSDQQLTLIRVTDRLTLLPAGRPDPDPMSGLTSVRMQRILEEAAARFDWVILDAPPVAPVADAGLLAGMAGGTLLVVRAGQTRLDAVQGAVDAVGRERILGVVLNGATNGKGEYRRYYSRQQLPASEG